MDKSEMLQNSNVRRKILSLSVAYILQEKKCQHVDKACIETLTEMLQSLLVEIGQSSKTYCELTGRTVPVIGDVIIAAINMGLTLHGIEAFAKREGRHIIPMPQLQQQQKQSSLLQTGTKAPHASYVLPYLPAFPDSHAYIRTPTYRQPVTEYEAIREKAANQKRDIERSLTKFLTRTSKTISLFGAEDSVFPLVSYMPTYPPYLSALHPSDQVFDFEELEYHYLVANRTEDCKDEDDTESNDEDGTTNTTNDNTTSEEKSNKNTSVDNNIKPNSTTNKAILENPNIDNPYLRAAALPKRCKTDPLLAISNVNFAKIVPNNTTTINQ